MGEEVASWKIRDMTGDDYEKVVRLWLHSGMTWFSGQDIDSREGLLKQQASGACDILVAEAAGDNPNIVGIVIASHDQRHGAINRLAVAPEYRRRGLAKALVRAAESRLKAKGIQRVWAMTHKNNTPAISLFTSLGYAFQADFIIAFKRLKD